MKAPITHAIVLMLTVLAHAKRRHRGRCPVVWHVARDGETGAALGAVDERISVAPVCRIEQLPQARLTGRQICWNRHPSIGLFIAVNDGEGIDRLGGKRRGANFLDNASRRGGRLESPHERIEHLHRPKRMNRDSAAGIPHVARNPVLDREAIDPGTKPHTLNDPANVDTSAGRTRTA
jgi:hypothetical protein